MATLLLLRHASAESRDDDAARRLTPAGQREALAMGRLLADRGFHPARILCSSAARAQETVDGLLVGAGECLADVPVTFDRRLYLASPAALRACVAEDAADLPGVLVVAHNPGLYELARSLVGDTDAGRMALSRGFPPASLAAIELSSGLAAIESEHASLIEVARPQHVPLD